MSTYPEELIGTSMEVLSSTNPSEVGIKGKVVDETKATLKIEVAGKIVGKIKTLLKSHLTIKLATGEIIAGKNLLKRPEERIKK